MNMKIFSILEKLLSDRFLKLFPMLLPLRKKERRTAKLPVHRAKSPGIYRPGGSHVMKMLFELYDWTIPFPAFAEEPAIILYGKVSAGVLASLWEYRRLKDFYPI
jgi:hypothetical protein